MSHTQQEMALLRQFKSIFILCVSPCLSLSTWAFAPLQVTISAKLASGMDHHLDGQDRVSAVPYSRWDLDSLWRGEKAVRARFGAFLPDAAGFDCGAFGITVPEAELMDPQQRMLLEVLFLWETNLSPSMVIPDKLSLKVLNS